MLEVKTRSDVGRKYLGTMSFRFEYSNPPAWWRPTPELEREVGQLLCYRRRTDRDNKYPQTDILQMSHA